MKKGIKIVTIGGGSSYTPELVDGFLKRYESLPVKELWLVDVPEGEHKMQVVAGLARRMVKRAGGLFKGLRTIPVIMDICRDMQELCPKAWLINFTNPVGMVMEGIHKYTDFHKIIGLCNVPIGMHRALQNF